MKTANDYARVAQEIIVIVEKVRPKAEQDPYTEIRSLMVYHLRKVAADARKIAEAIAAQERRPVNDMQDYNTSGS